MFITSLFSNIKLWCAIGLIAIIGAAIWKYNSVIDNLEEANQKIIAQDNVILLQDNAIQSMKDDIKSQARISVIVEEKFKKADDIAAVIERKLTTTKNGNTRDLGKLIDRHPEMLERIINQATSDSLECIRIASGSVEKEKDISHVNSQCPSLFTHTSTN